VIGRAAALWSLVAALVFAGELTLAAELTPQQQRGKQLYLTGESAAKRPVTALLGEDDVEVAATVVPCASCHARDGRGRSEGGIQPANLQWDVLTHPAATDDRTRIAYTPSLLKRAVTMGLDSSSRALAKTMPRYRMTLDDMADLLSYLEQLGTDREPGVTDDAVRLGVVLPARDEERQAVRKTLESYFARINGGGGIFGRRIDPRFTVSAGTADERATALAGFIKDDHPFAIAAAWLSGADVAMSAIAEKAHVPTIAAFSAQAPSEDRYVFRLLAGVREQSLALVAAVQPETNAHIALLTDDDAAATPIRDDLTAAGFTHVAIAKTIPAGAAVVLFLGAPSGLEAVLEQAAAVASPPRLLIPAAHSGGDLTAAPLALDGRIFVALPSSPDDVTEEGAAELGALEVPPAHATACRLALASARLMVEALRRNGRDLDRDALVSTLETFYRTPTTLTPPITWTASRHTGTHDVRIVALDLREKRWTDRGWWSGAR
jgi:ABC-type branched-subunit amino acid transport system substrate-binding protein